jgi:hypothetical protein
VIARKWSETVKPTVSPGWVMTLAAYTTGPVKLANASRTPAPSNAGIVLVNRLPGARTMTVAVRMAWMTSDGAAAPTGSTATLDTAGPTSRIADSPRVTVPSA